MACLDPDLEGGEYLSNCYAKPTEGVDGCSTDKSLWSKLWVLTAKHINENTYEQERERCVVNKEKMK